MSRPQPSREHKPGPVTSRTRTALLVFAILVVAAMAVILLKQPGRPPASGQPDAAATTKASPAPDTNSPGSPSAPAATVGNPKLQPLLGRWVRVDGNYLVVIDRIEPNGEMRAGYFNPRPINVSRAEAFEKDGKAKIYLELRDEGYPGSYYDLEYRSTNDLLAGKYFQATMRETYEVEFVRMK
jgi:hypothetical protein